MLETAPKYLNNSSNVSPSLLRLSEKRCQPQKCYCNKRSTLIAKGKKTWCAKSSRLTSRVQAMTRCAAWFSKSTRERSLSRRGRTGHRRMEWWGMRPWARSWWTLTEKGCPTMINWSWWECQAQAQASLETPMNCMINRPRLIKGKVITMTAMKGASMSCLTHYNKI